jgi:hypothetical protein
MSGEGLLRAAPATTFHALDEHALTSAVEAYDAERIASWRRDGVGPGTPMSARNMETIRPMIAAAISAYLEAVR